MQILDAHVQMGPGLRSHLDEYRPLYAAETTEQLLSVLERASIAGAVIFAPRWEGGDFIDPEYQLANDAVIAAVHAAPSRLFGLCRVNPNYGPRAHAELERGLRAGFRGLYLDPEWDSFNVNNSRLVGPLMEIARSVGAPVLVDTGWSPAEPGIVLRLAEGWPTVPIIMGHMGQRLIADALIVASHAPNVFLETSQCVDSFIRQAIRRLGPERILWGSGLPFHIPEVEIMKVGRYRDVSDAEKAAVFGGNLRRLLNVN